MKRTSFAAAACAVLLSMNVSAADLPVSTMPRALAREVVGKTVELVESKGVYPRRQAEYAQARAELLAAVDGDSAEVDRKDVYRRIGKLLGTLDADGHSFLIAPRQQLKVWRPPEAGLPPPSFSLVETGHGTVLRWTPPATTDGEARFHAYAQRMSDEAAAHPDFAQACALVVDLSEQTGGNMSAPFMVMYPLFGDANQAKVVDRDGTRTSLGARTWAESMHRQYAPELASPLAAYATGPLAVVVGKDTSSAGEMLLVALMGEDRVQTFGRTSQGMSSMNQSYPLPDGAILVLTEHRYAVGEGPVFHGGIPPMHPAAIGELMDAVVKTAAEWATANSPRCKAGN